MKLSLPLLLMGLVVFHLAASELQPPGKEFIEKHCADCHDSTNTKGNLDLSKLRFDTQDAKSFGMWVKVHDKIRDGEMPPKSEERPQAGELASFMKNLAEPLQAADLAREARDGRAVWRRLNRYEYENSLRDLLGAPWLQIKSMLPEDGESLRFNKLGEALDVSHVQMSSYLNAAEYALREVMARQTQKPDRKITRYYTRDMRSFTNKMKFSVFNTRPERATFPVLDFSGQPDVRSGKAPLTVGAKDPALREREAMGMVASAYEPIEPVYEAFSAPQAGHYKLRLNAYSVWVGPGKDAKWFIPDLDKVSKGRRSEPVTLYGETRPRLLRRLGAFDITPEPAVHELDVWLVKGETIRPDPARFFRSRPPAWHNPLAEKDGQPGVAFKWLEVEGPLIDEWPTPGEKLLFGDLPIEKPASGKGIAEIKSATPREDAQRLLKNFIERAYRRPVAPTDLPRFETVVATALAQGASFTEALLAGYSAVLCSPEFVCLEEKPGLLDDYALAARLSFFLWNSAPDETLRKLAASGELHTDAALRAQTQRLLNDPRARRFVDAFLDYWLDLRKLDATSPDAGLYPDYYLDDLLVESAQLETQTFFAELLRANLPARNVVASDFAMLNERLATHYGIPGVQGVDIRKVALPPGSPRGGLMTQASVLKVTANGTTTSPVVRGVWIMERILGKAPPPPPTSVPAVEPDIRGATTIREQLLKHRTQASCNACHAKIDPPGFALESFDVFGGWRDNYRANGEGKKEIGFGKNGQPFAFHLGPKVDAGGELPGGGAFKDIRELTNLLLADERQLARNLARQLTVFATGAPIHFCDRAKIETILDRTAANHYGVRSLVEEVVLSDLFRMK